MALDVQSAQGSAAAVPPSVAPGPARSSRSSAIAYRALCLLALLLIVPGLRVGALLDDWFHGYDAHAQAPWSDRVLGLYEFFHANEVGLARAEGMLPWWSDDRLSIAFFRPLSSLFVSLDHLLLDGAGFWSHVHSAAWYALCVLAAGRVLVLLFGAGDARWATLIFALSSCHVLPLAMVAARHSHVTAVFALFSFECLIRAVRGGGARFTLLSLVLLVLAFAAGESAIVILPLSLGYLWAERGPSAALRWLAPHILVALAFSVFYFASDFGTHHSGAYLQPGSSDFFGAAPERWLVLVGGLLAGLPPDFWLFGAAPLLVVGGVLGLLLGALVLRRVTAELDASSARRLLGLLVGALGSLVPLAAGIPGGRLLVLPSLASAAFFGIALRQAAHAWRAGSRRRGGWLGAWALVFGIGMHPLIRVAVPADMLRIGRELPEVARGVGRQCAGATALAVGMPDPNLSYLPSLYLSLPPSERPRVFHILSMAPGRHRLSQIGPAHFELEVEGNFFELPWARIYRDTPLSAALSRTLQGVELEVLEASATRTRLDLRLSPGSPVCWLTLEQGAFSRLDPGPGQVLDWLPSVRPR
jgi:hypothetical protein